MIALTIAVAAVALVAHGAPRADAQVPDVPTADYDLGARLFVEPGGTGRFARIPIRLWGAVAVPAGSGPAPVVVVGHGSHGDGCPGEFGDWPCFGVEQRNDLGLRYLVRQLARVGFVAVAPDVNASFTGGFGETQDHEYRRYAEVVDATLTALRTASTGGPNRFSVPLQGRVDPARVGLVGHARGGKNLLRWVAANRAAVGAIVLVAPLFDPSVTVPDVPTALLLGTCDEDTGRTGAGYLVAGATQRRPDAALLEPHDARREPQLLQPRARAPAQRRRRRGEGALRPVAQAEGDRSAGLPRPHRLESPHARAPGGAGGALAAPRRDVREPLRSEGDAQHRPRGVTSPRARRPGRSPGRGGRSAA